MSQDHAAPPRGAIRLNALISRVAAELIGSARDLKAVQNALDATSAKGLSADQATSLQKLDIAEQTVRALADIGMLLSSVLSDDHYVSSDDVLSGCRLSSLVDRLMGLPSAETNGIEIF